MQDPSFGVPPHLLPHLHLVSNYRYPVTQNLHTDAALSFLLNAHRIVRQMQPMVWQYIQQPPNDGTVFLAWQPTTRQGTRFSSDGYIWADVETPYHFEMRGFTIEVLVHRSGFRPNIDTVTCHARHRYRIIGKQPHILDEFDPNLWIIHYGPTDLQHRLPTQQIRILPEVHQTIQQRVFIERQGQLQRKEFMLYDQSQWPNVSFSREQMFHAGPVPPRAPQYYQPPQGPDDPRAKRQRVEGPPGGSTMVRPRGPSMGMPYDSSLEDEENAQLGDFLDHLTPRDISTLRYKQHHEWMEEIFSSVYATAQILPEDLGFGLAGDLEDLTKGILDTPGMQQEVKPADKQALVRRGDETGRTYQKLDREQMDELEKRIGEFMEKGQMEVKAMKAEHAKKLGDAKRARTYMQAERRLREAGVTFPGSITDIVHHVEAELGVAITPRKDFTCVEKGGLEEEKKAPAPVVSSNVNGTGDMANGATNGHGLFNGLDSAMSMGIGMGGDANANNDNSAAGLLDQFGSGSYENTPRSDGPRIPTPAQIPSQGQSAGATPVTAADSTAAHQQQHSDFEIQNVGDDGGLDTMPDDSGLDFLEGMDLDVPIGDGDSVDAEAGGDKPEDEWVLVNDSAEQNAEGASENAQPGTATTGEVGTTTTQELDSTTVASAGARPAIDVPSSVTEPAGPSDDTADASAGTAANDDDIFGDITGAAGDDEDGFNDFGMDSAGDALADYGTAGDVGGDDGLGLELGDSTAFDEAFQVTVQDQGEGVEDA